MLANGGHFIYNVTTHITDTNRYISLLFDVISFFKIMNSVINWIELLKLVGSLQSVIKFK